MSPTSQPTDEPEIDFTHAEVIEAELSLEDALEVAITLHRRGHFDDAETVYQRILAIEPNQSDAIHFLGVLSHQRGRKTDAVDLIRRSIELNPNVPDRHNNLGNVLVEQGRAEEASDAYEAALRLRPECADFHNNHGAVLRALGQFDAAEAAYRKAIELQSTHVDAFNNLGNLLSGRGRIHEAVQCFCRAITLMPHNAESRRMLGTAYYTLGQLDDAAKVFKSWLDDEPDNPIARHMYSACSGVDVPERAPDNYVESTFDGFAASFDAKLGKLDYRAPEVVAEAVARFGGTPEKRLTCLDAGCGTGLCGPMIAPFVSRLVGVDLSSGMLDRARDRGVYDELVKAELTAYLLEHPASFDLIISADTLVYFGALDAVMAAAAASLTPGGLLFFTVESAEAVAAGARYTINPHGRYSHAKDYLETVLSGAGLSVLAIESEPLRREGGKPVIGWAVSASKPRAD